MFGPPPGLAPTMAPNPDLYCKCKLCGRQTLHKQRQRAGRWYCDMPECLTWASEVRWNLMVSMQFDPEWGQYQPSSDAASSSAPPPSWRAHMDHSLGLEYEVRRRSLLRIQARYDEEGAVSQYTLRVLARAASRHGWLVPLVEMV